MFEPTFKPVSDRPNFPENERNILKKWKDEHSFQESLRRSEGKKNFRFYDGPPFATGLPHYGHILAGSIKDVVTRYAHQTGHHVPRRFGWDCHGLPIEYEIDKHLGVKSVADVTERIGVAKYNEECRAIVMKHRGEWKDTVERMGRWIDFDNDYKTLNSTFMESVWWVFGELFRKGLVYRDFKVMPYSVACSTPLSNFESGQNYKDVSDPSIVVAFKICDAGRLTSLYEDAINTELLAWTTTPWTLPANMALTTNPDLDYICISFADPAWAGRKFWVAASLLGKLLKDLKLKVKAEDVLAGKTDVTVHANKVRGSEFVGVRYEPLYDTYACDTYWTKRAWVVISDSYVTADDGTGIVHCAPAFGEDDARVALLNGVTEKGGNVPCHVDEHGNIAVGPFAGTFFKDADKKIKDDLKGRGLLLVNDMKVHSYPHCWRSDTPLMYRAVSSWFVRVTAIKETLIQNNMETQWVPAAIQEKRFHNWLVDARDWCISRNRFWGTPIPLWVSEDYTQVVAISSIDELQKYTDTPITDIHRHFIDDITIPDPRGDEYPPLHRVGEVFDCWFESGSMPYAERHYPFEHQETFHEEFPADFVAEGLDQTRGWFYTLSVLSAALFGRSPFKNLVVNGLVLAADGKKMSKRLKNYTPPTDIFEASGADAVRLFLLNSPALRAEPVKFSDSGVREVVKSILLPWYHAVRFLIQETTRIEIREHRRYQFEATPHCKTPLDQWVISKTHSLIKFFHEEMKAYRLYSACSQLLNFLDELTNLYIRLNRDRMRSGEGISVLFRVLLDLTTLLAPFTPFMSEFIYDNLKRALPKELQEPSIHFCMLPIADESLIHRELELEVKEFQDIVVAARLLRDRKKFPIKNVARRMDIYVTDVSQVNSLLRFEKFIQEELNIFELNIIEATDQVKLVAKPNFKLLGSKYGKLMKDLAKAIPDIDSNELRKLATDPNYKVHVLGVELDAESIEITRTHVGIVETETLAVECLPTAMLVLNLSVTEEIQRLTICREAVTRIQRGRKEAGLKLDDDVIQCIRTDDEVLILALTQGKENIESSLRRSFHINYVAPEQPLYATDTTIGSHDAVVLFFSKCKDNLMSAD